MKTSKLFLSIACVVILSGFTFACSNDNESEDMSIEYACPQKMRTRAADVEDRIQADIKLMMSEGMLTFDNNRYSLEVSEAEALARGVSEETYRELCRSLKEINKMFEDIEEEYAGKEKPVIKDCTLETPLSQVKRLSAGPEVKMPSGTIYTSNTYPGSNTVSRTPHNMTAIKANCYASAFLPVHVVKTFTIGNPVIQSRLGNGNMTVGINASNTTLTVQYNTSCQSGGTCAWQGQS